MYNVSSRGALRGHISTKGCEVAICWCVHKRARVLHLLYHYTCFHRAPWGPAGLKRHIITSASPNWRAIKAYCVIDYRQISYTTCARAIPVHLQDQTRSSWREVKKKGHIAEVKYLWYGPHASLSSWTGLTYSSEWGNQNRKMCIAAVWNAD